MRCVGGGDGGIGDDGVAIMTVVTAVLAFVFCLLFSCCYFFLLVTDRALLFLLVRLYLFFARDYDT